MRSLVSGGEESRNKEVDPTKADQSTEPARELAADRFIERNPDPNAEKVNHTRCEHEADGIIGGVGGERQLGPVSMPVAQREEANQN